VSHDADAPAPSGPEYCAHTEYTSGPPVEDLPATGEDATGLEAAVWEALYEVEDPEMPVSVVDLGLIYGVTVEDRVATVSMTLTYTGCPARDILTEEVATAAASADGIEDASVELVWSPDWSIELVTEDGREALRDFGVSI
jgi:metal-sulfur cluster biosynthetic enzyme